MTIYIARHGNAEDNEQTDVDENRGLTKKGIKRIERVAELLDEFDAEPEFILCSPFARTRQTAEIYADYLDDPEIIVKNELTETASPEPIYQKILSMIGKIEELMIVGHHDNLGMLLGMLLEIKAPLYIKKGAVFILECNRTETMIETKLCGYITPKMAKKL